MIKTIKAILAPAVITVLLLSCKKDNTGNSEPTLIKNEATKVQAWFNSQPNVSAAKLPAATALYINTVSYIGSGINITPMQLAGSTASQAAGKFLVTNTDAAGNITGGNFYIVLNKTNLSLTNLITPGFLSLGNIPETFTGGIIKYDVAGNMLSSVHIEAGKVMNGQQDVLSTTQLKPASGSTTNLAPPPSGQVCTDWYYQHFENGILIWEDYLFTSCEDGGNTSGGGGSSNNCQDALNAFTNEGHNVPNGTLVDAGIPNTGNDWNITYNWVIFTAGTWGINSYENATLQKMHYPNIDLWEYTAFAHSNATDFGVSIGGTRTFDILSTTGNISPSKTKVQMKIFFKVTSRVCAIAPLALTYTSTGTAYAPNNIGVQ